MSFGKFAKLLGVAAVIFVLLFFAGSLFLGPGVADYSERIYGEYFIFDAGGYEQVIIRRPEEGQSMIVIDARVTDFKVIGERLLVFQQPRIVTHNSAKVAGSELDESCVIWTIDTETHEIDHENADTNSDCKFPIE